MRAKRELILKIKSEFREMVHFFFFLRYETEGLSSKQQIHLPLIARDLCVIVNDDGGLDWIGGGAPKKQQSKRVGVSVVSAGPL